MSGTRPSPCHSSHGGTTVPPPSVYRHSLKGEKMKAHHRLSILALCALPLGALAQGGIFTLPAVTVTEPMWGAGGFEEEEKKTAGNRQIFDKEVIEHSTAENVSDFLQQMGFAVIPGPTPFQTTDITIRGFDNGHHWNESSSRILFLINGRRSGVNNIRQLAINNVERIEIIRGPEMLMYSAGSPGGVVNIITKRGGTTAFSGSLETGFGSYSQRKNQFSLSGAKSGFDYALSYVNDHIDDYKDGKGNTVTNSGVTSINGFNGSLGYTLPDDNHRFGVEYYYYDVNNARRPQYWDEEEGTLKDPSYVDRSTYLVALTYQGHSLDRRWNWDASYSISKDEYISISDPAKRHSQYWMGNKIETNQAKVDLNYIGDQFDLSFGMDYIKYETHNSGTPKRNSTYYNYPIGYPLQMGHDTENMGISALGTLKLLDNTLNLTGGLRWEYDRIKDRHTGDEPWWGGWKDPWYGDRVGSKMPTRRTFDHLSPALGVTYLPYDWLKLRASYVDGFRSPGGRQLFSSDATEGYGAPGYPLLKAEKSDNFEVGFDLSWPAADLSFTYFYSKFENHITIRGIQTPICTGNANGSCGPSAQNADERIQAGVELSGSIDVARLSELRGIELRPYVSMTYMTKRDELFMRGFDGTMQTPASYAGQWAVINGIPRFTANYGIRFRHHAWGTNANLNFFYVGETWTGSSPGNYNPNLWTTYGKFTVANLSISQPVYRFEGGQEVVLKLQANNLFDKQYKYSSNAADVLHQGRNFYLGVQANF